MQPVAQQVATATTVGASTASPATSTVATVVSYTTIVDVANADARLRPGMTADVVLPGMRREHAVRIPNSALAFRPPPDVLKAIGEVAPASPGEGEDDRRVRAVEDDGRRFTPIAVRAGVADELMDGAGKRLNPSRRRAGDERRGAAPAPAVVNRTDRRW